MKLLGDRLLISPLPVREKSEGGIILPQGQAGDVKHYWRVDQVGTGKRGKDGEFVPLDFSVGDIIVTALYHDHTVLEDGTDRRIVGTDQIIAKLETVPDLRVV
jgi:co-chaperonin GroES (HSP10)